MIRTERFRPGTHPVTAPFAEIVLDRPDKRNALTPAMLASLVDAVRELDGDDGVRAIVLRGAGPVFCAGFDLALCTGPDGDATLRALLEGLADAIRALRRASVPVVAAAHGAAIAGGCALLGGADVVIADPGARFGYPVARLGISPAVSAPTLADLLRGGPARSRLLDTRLVDGTAARRLGLVHRLVDTREDVHPRAQLEGQHLAGKPPRAMAATKAWLGEIERSTDDAVLGPALAASLALVGHPEQRARLAAWLERV